MREQNDGGGGGGDDDDDDDINCGSILANTIFKGDAHAFTAIWILKKLSSRGLTHPKELRLALSLLHPDAFP